LVSGKWKGGDKFTNRFKRMIDGDFQPFMQASGQAVVRDLIANIKIQREVNEKSMLAKNEQSTVDAKARKGRPALSLIDEGRLIKSSSYDIEAKKTNCTIAVSDNVRPDKGWWWFDKYKFFGFSPTIRKKLYENLLKYLRGAIRGGR
jgi:hypothetical protein